MHPKFAAKAGLFVTAEGRDGIRAALTVEQRGSDEKPLNQLSELSR
jgi:hypothetical protein